MTAFLRFVGLVNAAVWCGSGIFLVIALPAVFSPDMRHLLTDRYVGFPAEAIISRYFILQYWCGGIALAHLLGEWIYCGRRLWRLNLWLVSVVLILGLAGGLWLQPRMRALHIAKYFGRVELQAEATKSFATWHAISETVNVVMIVALVWYLWRVSKVEEPPRFVDFSKIRG